MARKLIVMARDEISSIPQEFISAPQGVYFNNPDPASKKIQNNILIEKYI